MKIPSPADRISLTSRYWNVIRCGDRKSNLRRECPCSQKATKYEGKGGQTDVVRGYFESNSAQRTEDSSQDC